MTKAQLVGYAAENGISIIATTYYAAIIKSSADRTLDSLGAETKRRR